MVPNSLRRTARWNAATLAVTAAAAVAFAVALSAPIRAQAPPPPPPAQAAPARAAPSQAPPDQAAPAQAPPAAAPASPAEDPGRTAGSALGAFMASRDYRTIRELKAVMGPALRAAYDHDSTPFNGKKGFRLSAFDYREPALKPTAQSCVVTVKSLWDDQGETVELRTENVRLARDGDAPWRVTALEKSGSEPLRYKESIAGVTTLRMILRAWIRRDLESARPHMADQFLKRFAGREEGLEALFGGDPATRRAAFRILEMVPNGSSDVLARVRLVETPPGRPTGLEGIPHEIALVRKGQRWLLSDWK